MHGVRTVTIVSSSPQRQEHHGQPPHRLVPQQPPLPRASTQLHQNQKTRTASVG